MQLFPSNGKKGPAALTNDKQENVDQIQAVKRRGVCINRKKYKIFFPQCRGIWKMLRPATIPRSIYAFQPNSNPSRDPVPYRWLKIKQN